MQVAQAIILSVVEGVTEFLPISSTAHMELAARLLGLMQSDAVKSFEIIIQLGAILAVALECGKRLKNWEVLKRVGVTFVPTGILGVVAYKVVKKWLLGNSFVAVAALVVGGIFMIGWEKMRKNKTASGKIEELGLGKCVVVGVCQAVAMVPGVSRALATIVGGEAMGLSRPEAAELSFLVAIPTMAAATGLDLLKGGVDLKSAWVLGIGFIGAFLSAKVVVGWFLKYVKTHGFSGFGWYRIGIGLLWAGWLISG
jgi:undecaprenyl-diphosphatase